MLCWSPSPANGNDDDNDNDIGLDRWVNSATDVFSVPGLADAATAATDDDDDEAEDKQAWVSYNLVKISRIRNRSQENI